MPKIKLSRIFAFTLLLVFFGHATAQNSILRVGVPVPYAPFTYLLNGVPHGISIDLWEEVAIRNKLQYTYVILDRDMGKHTVELDEKKYDVLLGPLTINDAMLGKIQYSVPYFVHTINILTFKQKAHFSDLFENVLKKYLGAIICIYIAIFFIYINAVWLIERFFYDENSRKNKGTFVPKSYFKGMWLLFYYHISFGDHFFDCDKTNVSKLLYLIYVYTTFAFLAIMGASLTSVLTVSLNTENQVALNENTLNQKTFAYMSDRPFYKIFAEHRNLHVIGAKNMDNAVDMLNQHKVDGIINNITILHNYSLTHNVSDKVISPFALGYIFIYFGFSSEYHGIDAINQSIMELQQEGWESLICKKYDVPDIKYCSFY